MRKYFISNFFKNEMLKSSIGLITISFLVKIFGYTEKLVLAKYYGTSYEVDVYTVIITIVLSFFYFFREVVEPGFLRVFLDAKKVDIKKAWDLFNWGIRLILIVTIPIALIVCVFPKFFISFFAPGFDDLKLHLAKEFIQIAIPATVFLALSTLTSIILNANKKFLLPASGELVFKGVIILFLFFLYDDYGIYGAIIGIVIGSIGRLIVHLIGLYDKIKFKKTIIERTYKNKIWALTWPLLIGVGFSQISSLIDNGFASYLQEGAIAALSYSKKIIELPVILFPYILSIVAFPYFSELAIEKDNKKLKELLGKCLKYIVIMFLPITVLFLVYPSFIIEVIFQRGAFEANSTLLTSKPLFIYSIGLVFFAIETILVVFYYAKADTKTPVFVGIGCVILNILLTWLFVDKIGYVGIALALVIQKIIKNSILLLLLKNKMNYCIKYLLSFLLKLFGATILFSFLLLFGELFFLERFNYSVITKIIFIGANFSVAGICFVVFLGITKVISWSEFKK